METCAFCEGSVDSAEHMWPLWILKLVKPREKIRRKIEDSTTWTDDPEVKIKSVCGPCNSGWMSRLENTNKPHMSLLVQDFSLPLDKIQQEHLARWAMKTAMILDSVEGHNRFYRKADCENFKAQSRMPTDTKIWLGRFFGNGLHGDHSDFSVDTNDGVKVGTGSVCNICVGHLVFQVLSVRVPNDVKIEPRPGPWNDLLIPIWPPTHRQIYWPPPLSVTLYGTFPIAALIYRWRPVTLRSSAQQIRV